MVVPSMKQGFIDTYVKAGTSTPTGPLGTLYTKQTWSDLSDFTNNGSTVSVVANALQFSGGVGNTLQTLDISAYGYSCLEYWKLTAQVKVGTKNSTSYGFGLGLRSTNSTFGSGSKFSALGAFAMTSGGAFDGKVSSYAGPSPTVTGTSSGALSFSVNDVIQLIVERTRHTITVTASNITNPAGSVSVSYTYITFPNSGGPYMGNTGKFAIYSVGGTFTVQSLLLESQEYKNARMVFIGDSKTVGYDSTGLSTRFASLVASTYPSSKIVVSAGGSDGLAEHLARINELKSLTPAKYVICGASNDIRVPRSSGAINTDYASLVSQLSAVAPVIHTTGLKETMSQASLQTYINANYSAANIIDTLGTTLSLDTDTVHPLDAGHSTFAGLLTASGKI